MADLDGFETAALIRQHERARETPIIFLSAIHTETHYARQGLSLGAVDYIYKPFDPDLLRDKVRSFVALYRERRARQSAENALQMKDLILGVLGHDLRSPVTAICASAEMLLKDEEADERRAALVRICASAHRMDRMVRSLVDYARTYFGAGIPVFLGDERMDRICQRVIDEVSSTHPAQRIELETVGDVAGNWDADRVAQALANLVINAAEHAKGLVRVRCRRRRRRGHRHGEQRRRIPRRGARDAVRAVPQGRRRRARPRARPVHRARGRRRARRPRRAHHQRRADALYDLLAAPSPHTPSG